MHVPKFKQKIELQLLFSTKGEIHVEYRALQDHFLSAPHTSEYAFSPGDGLLECRMLLDSRLGYVSRLLVTTVQKDAETNTRPTIPIVTRGQLTKLVFPHICYHKTPICPKDQREICGHLNATHLKTPFAIIAACPQSPRFGAQVNANVSRQYLYQI